MNLDTKRLERCRVALMAGLLLAVVALKFWLVQRININWDEFHYLEFVHAARAGTPVPLFQTLHVWLFSWLPLVSENEAVQVIVARYVMMVGVLGTSLMLWRIAHIWISGWPAWIAPLAYILAFPVFNHAGAFRADSLLAPLLTASVLLLCLDRRMARVALSASLFGLAIAFSIKSVLALPMLLAGVMLGGDACRSWRPRLVELAIFGGVAASIAAVCLLAHGLAIAPFEESAGSSAARAASRTILEQPWFPTRHIFQVTWRIDRMVWLLIAGGFVVALFRRNYVAATLVSVFAPLAFYRNAFPYYYVVILTPTAVLSAFSVSWIFETFAKWRNFRLSSVALWIALMALLVAKLWLLWGAFRADRVTHQVEAVEAVHQIFLAPVPYIDHSGMIGSFPKASFFMSSWGVYEYRRKGIPFTRHSVAVAKAPLLVVNRGVLEPGSKSFTWLMPEDQATLLRGYIPWWGIIRVAGARGRVCREATPNEVHLPYPGSYRLVSDEPVRMDGRLVEAGEVVELGSSVRVSDAAGTGCSLSRDIEFTIVDSRVAGVPKGKPARAVFYDEL